MIKSYLKTIWRNFVRNKLFSFINLIGLSVGIAAVLLIGIYFQNELSYDNFHKNSDSLYRVGFEFFNTGKSLGKSPEFTPPFGPDAQSEFPEIQSFCRISGRHEVLITKGENKIKSSNICFADSTFFDVFAIPLISGDPKKVLCRQPGRRAGDAERSALSQFGRYKNGGCSGMVRESGKLPIVDVLRGVAQGLALGGAGAGGVERDDVGAQALGRHGKRHAGARARLEEKRRHDTPCRERHARPVPRLQRARQAFRLASPRRRPSIWKPPPNWPTSWKKWAGRLDARAENAENIHPRGER